MKKITLVAPALWEVEVEFETSKKFRLDHSRVSDLDFQLVRENALQRHIPSILQLITWARKNIAQTKVQSWVAFFERLNLNDAELMEFYLKGYLLNHIGESLRFRNFKDHELNFIANNPVLRNWILHSFVDYDTLHKDLYYNRLVAEMDPQNLEQETFKKSVILTGYYLDGNVQMMRKWSEALSRYPTDKNYFPIINGRVWAAKFIHQMLKTGALQSDLVQDWFEVLKEEPLEYLMPFAMEPLPILVRFGANTQQIQEVMEFLGPALHLNLLQNPFVASLENAVFLACKTSFFSRIKDTSRAQEFRQELYRNSCLPSYRNYLYGIANSF